MQLIEELEETFEHFTSDFVEISSLEKAFNYERISEEELNFLEAHDYKLVINGETTIFASKSGNVFTEFDNQPSV